MRDCPVCGSKDCVDKWVMDYLVPDGWELPTHNIICLCRCGFIYHDNDKTQIDYDLYYKNRYDTDWTLTSEKTHKRLAGLARDILRLELDKDACIVDFGGGEGIVEKLLRGVGCTNVQTVRIGDKLPPAIDLLVISHVLEHIYDLKGTMERLCMKVRGRILIDVPDAVGMSRVKTLPILDYNQKHINHFTTRTLNMFMEQFGYFPVWMDSYTVESHNYPSMRILYEGIDENEVFLLTQMRIKNNINSMVSKLKEITGPVIVWGVGDICMLLLKQVPLNVVYYVDNDPAFHCQTINGIPVLDHVESNEPIVVMAQLAKDAVLAKIKESGLTNRIIVI
jgi:hypothetical protein